MQFLKALYLVVTFSCQTSGQCVFPCSYQNRTYRYVATGTNTTYEQAVFSPPGNLTKVITYINGIEPLYIECVHRSGPFNVIRYYNGTDWLYRCNKDTSDGPDRDVIVVQTNDWETFSFYPTLCDVCNGLGFKNVLSLVGVGNIIE
ncbi:uncharacterized protein LOC134681561 [Mytilus trossulus]|uniref:uncharacterized protein LOC134681561 n=1 Tax=Mytilus trossulus TaxID=6551 RepID=UPI00300621B3